MITKKTMTIQDFVDIMACNTASYPDYANLPEESKRFMAQLNISTGVAESYFDDGKLFGIGGIRYCGIGEAWMLTTPEARTSKTRMVFRTAVKNLTLMRDNLNLIKVYADGDISSNFLEHLDFKKTDNTLLWIRS
jgi:hypothetical protein